MQVFGTTLTFWQILILLMIAIGTIFGILFMLVTFFKRNKVNLKTPAGELLIESLSKNNSDENESSTKKIHETVEFGKREFLQIITQIKTAMATIEHILHETKIKKQMKFARERLLAYNLQTEKNFRNSLFKINTDMTILEKDIKQINCLIELVFHKILEILKDSFKENGFETKVQIEFDDYLKRKYALIAQAVKNIQNDFSTPLALLSSDELIILLETWVTDQQELIREIYRNAQKEYTCAQENAFEEEKKLDEFIWSLAEIRKEKK